MLPIDLPQSAGIYKLYFLDPNRFYIGSAVNLRKRYQHHLHCLRRGTHPNLHLQRAFQLYGAEKLHFGVIEHVEHRADLLAREQHYLDSQPYYNMSRNASSPQIHPIRPETREKFRQLMMGNTRGFKKGQTSWNKGVPLSAEWSANVSRACKGRAGTRKGCKLSPEHIAMLVKLHTGKPSWNKGVPMRDESRQKLIATKTGKPCPHPNRKARTKWEPYSPEAKERIRAAKAAMTPEQREQRLQRWRTTLATQGPEQQAKRNEKWRATMSAKTPEERAQEIERWRISKYGKKPPRQDHAGD